MIILKENLESWFDEKYLEACETTNIYKTENRNDVFWLIRY